MTERLAATPAMRQRQIVTDFSFPAKPKPPGDGLSKAERYRRTHQLLVARYPRIFQRPRPLAIGIDRELRARFTETEFSTQALQEFLQRWTKRPPYAAAIVRGQRRVHLDGRDAGPARAAANFRH